MTLAQAISNLTSADHNVMRRVHRWRAPRWIRWWAIGATRCGDGWLWGLCGLLILLARAPHQYDAIGAALLAVFSGILLFRLIKKSVGRKRPCTLEPHCWASHLLPPDQFSFPSGHSITAFAVAIPLGHFYPVAMPALLFCAGSVAASRVLLGMHFLSDVVVGSLLGAVLGYAAVALVI